MFCTSPEIVSFGDSVSCWTNATAINSLVTFLFCRQLLAGATEAQCCSLEQRPAASSLTCHVSDALVQDCREAQRCSLKLMKHQHPSLPPPPGRSTQPMSKLHRALQIISRWGHVHLKQLIHVIAGDSVSNKSCSTFTEMSSRRKEFFYTNLWGLMVFSGSARDYADKPTLRQS